MAKKKINEEPNKPEDLIEINKKKFETILHGLKKKYGDGFIRKLIDKELSDSTYISTGSLSLDAALGGRGLPTKRLVEIYGAPACGKTSLCIEIIRNAQLADPSKYQVLIDAERKLSQTMALDWGLDGKRLHIIKPVGGEAAIDQTEELINSKLVNVVVLDSVDGLRAMKEYLNSADQETYGGNSKLVSLAVHKWINAIDNNDCLLIFINQVRSNLRNPQGAMVRPGGWSVPFYESIRMKVATKGKTGLLKDDEGNLYGHKVYVTIEKNSVAVPILSETELYLEYGRRINPFVEVIKVGVDVCEVSNSGAWYEFSNGEKIQGLENAARYLENTPDFYNELRSNIAKLGAERPAKLVNEIDPDKLPSEGLIFE